MKITISKDLSAGFPEIFLELSEIVGISVVPKNNTLEEFKKDIVMR
jgi:hypothetical protein